VITRLAIEALVGFFLVANGWWLRTTLAADAVSVLIGGGVTLLAGLGAGWAVKRVDIPIPHPSLDFGDRHAAGYIGLLERIFFFSTIWIGQPAGRSVPAQSSLALSLSLLMLNRKKRSGCKSSVRENDVN